MQPSIKFNLIVCAIVTACCVDVAQGEDFGLGRIEDKAGWNVGYEISFLRPHLSHGTTTNNVFDFDYAPRLSLEYQAINGAGARLTYWGFDHDGFGAAPASIDTSNVDLDIFRRVQIGCGTDIELIAGLRWHEYDDVNWAVGGNTSFDALGGSLGVRARQQLGFGMVGYGRGRWSILADNAFSSVAVPAQQFDVVRDHQEIAFGLEKTVCCRSMTATLNGGLEWMNWDGYDDNADGAIAFTGFGFGATVNF